MSITHPQLEGQEGGVLWVPGPWEESGNQLFPSLILGHLELGAQHMWPADPAGVARRTG